MPEKRKADLIPRDYQTTMMLQALKGNVIACLGTGTGKTYIGVLVIKQLAYQTRAPFEEGGKRTFFLVPTVPLVHQQAGVLKDSIDLEIGSFFGDMNLDSWSQGQWEEQFIKFNVLVMTAEIFRAILQHGFLPLKKVNLIIFDECHRAVKNHPYREIMRNFDLCKDHPKVLGLTASILNGKCKPGQLQNKIKDLEDTLRSRAVIPDEMSELKKYGTKPKEVLVLYSCDFPFVRHGIVTELSLLLVQVLSNLEETKITPKQETYFDILPDNYEVEEEEGFDPNKIAKRYLTDVLDILKTLGLWCARSSLEVFVKELESVISRDKVDKDKLSVLKRVWSVFSASLEKLKMLFSNQSHEQHLTGDSASPKLKKLLEILDSKRPSLLVEQEKPLCGVIFVQKRFIAYVLNQWLLAVSKLPQYNFIVSNFMVGHGSDMFSSDIKAICMQSKQQRRVLEEFRNGDYNLLVASSVIEEGMDVPQCNLVVRFDPPSDYRAYVQSKGRARANNSIFILMSSADIEVKTTLLEDVTTYTSIEKILNNYCQERDVPTEEEIDDHMSDQLKAPYIPFPYDGGARVTMSSAISLLNRYCSKLRGYSYDSFTHHAPRWKIKKLDNPEKPYQCIIWLPLISPIREPIMGEAMKTKRLAKMAAALDACKILHKRGELSDNLLPINYEDELLEDDQSQESYRKELRLGASNVKDFYPKKILDLKPVDVGYRCYLYIINMNLVDAVERDEVAALSFFDPSTSPHRFALVVKEEMKKIVDFHIFTESGKVEVKLSRREPLHLTEPELQLIHGFHQYTFTEMLRVTPFPLKYISEKNTDFLLAPVLLDKDKSFGKSVLNFDLMERISRQDSDKNKNVNLNTRPASFVFNRKIFCDALVSPKFEQGELYYVIKISDDMTSKSPFPKDEYRDFEEYYSTKFSYKVVNQRDPLVQLKHVSNPILYMPGYFSQTGQFTKQSTTRLARSIHLLPELLMVYPFPGSLYKQATYLPCILSRVGSLLFVEAFRMTVVQEANIGKEVVSWPALDFPKYPIKTEKESHISVNEEEGRCKKLDTLFDEPPNFRDQPGPSPCLLLEALTTKNFGDMLDLERLETVGDSFLKYAVSVRLFCKYPVDNEGKLTIRKTRYISNANLLKLGKRKGIPSIICYSKMIPKENWLPPGFKYPPGFEETAAEMSNQVSKTWLEQNMNDIWNLPPEEIRARLLSLDENLKREIADAQGTTEPILINVSSNLRTVNSVGNKSVADCVEGLIGAYVVTTGVMGGLHFLNWLGIDVFPEDTNREDLTSCFPIPEQYVSPHSDNLLKQYLSGLDNLENTINYQFKNKLYLLEALWHPSCDRKPITGCYQRLEFVGDAVLDYLITRYLYEDPKRYNPGELTDIRMALVNNAYFAKLAVQLKFHHHMKYFAPNLLGAIRSFVHQVERNDLNFYEEVILDGCDGAAEELEVPKVLGDVVESVAGAIYLDSNMCLKTVWNVFYNLMHKDIEATRHSVPKHPVRQLYEEFPGQVKFQKLVEMNGKIRVPVDVGMNGRNHHFVGIALNKKTAKLTAAKIALKKLQR